MSSLLFEYSTDEWEQLQDQFSALDADFIAADRTGQLAVFTTFGMGYRPDGVFRSQDEYRLLGVALAQLPRRSTAIPTDPDRPAKTLASWHPFAERGLFAYDFAYEAACVRGEPEQYVLALRPSSPAHLDDLPHAIRSLPAIARFEVRFGHDLTVAALMAALQESDPQADAPDSPRQPSF